MKDYMVRGIDKLGKIRVFVARTTNLVEEARRIHNTSPTATAALGRTLTVAAIMGSMMKNEKDLLTLKISGDGPLGKIFVVANNRGHVKGEVDHPMADVPSRSDGKLDVGTLVGRNGSITTIMDLGLKDPYIGQSSIVSGEIAEDIANYYVVSEQVPSAVSLGVLVNKDITCKAAGGYIIQLMPGVTDEEISIIEDTLSKIDSMSTMIDKGLTPEEIVEKLLGSFEMEILDRLDLEYHCDCSREKIEKVIISLGKKEIQDIIEEDGQAEVVCHFCNTKYQFNKDELTKLLLTI
ncbi:Hsp33 family molecular chaperone HslO [Tissierella sp. Yu-01]|uniref:Hsp33 family molecular chaperone HslO n=1 Tax=Tissierella sp. Yu-01 TaxID=3035694 RepID=UPI00240CF9F4|nr:Hsp33 family molecular chaperone HslO [Tissierella sp. Yu-01]WFA09891.1 Hsp33 family molecular chaperone HslO [Tissierella sp. Yu-01]